MEHNSSFLNFLSVTNNEELRGDYICVDMTEALNFK